MLVFEDIQLSAMALQVVDHAYGDPWRAGLDRMDLKVAGLEVGDVSQKVVSLDSFGLALKGLAVDQPAGFGNAKAAMLEHMTVTGGEMDLKSPEVVIKQALIQGFTSSVIINKDGISNLAHLNQALFGAEPEIRASPAVDVEPEVSAHATALPRVLFEQIALEGGAIHFHDAALTEAGLALPLDNLQFRATQLRLFDDNLKADPASASLSFELGQPGDLPSAYFGSVAVLGPLRGRCPAGKFAGAVDGLQTGHIGGADSACLAESIGRYRF